MKRTDTQAGRFYDANGRKLPSVTTILSALAKPALVGWAAREERNAMLNASYLAYAEAVQSMGLDAMDAGEWQRNVIEISGEQQAHRRKMQDAATIGTKVHALIEDALTAELQGQEHFLLLETLEPKVRECIEKWLDWRQGVDLKVIAVEKRLASQDYGFAGTLDLLAEVDGEPSVIDFKTGKAIYAEAFLQNCAYRVALAEEGVATTKGFIVRLPKEETDPTFEVREVPPMDELLIPFVCLIPVWRWVHAQELLYQKKKREAKKAQEVANG
jgi:hypothetical protein